MRSICESPNTEMGAGDRSSKHREAQGRGWGGACDLAVALQK